MHKQQINQAMPMFTQQQHHVTERPRRLTPPFQRIPANITYNLHSRN